MWKRKSVVYYRVEWTLLGGGGRCKSKTGRHNDQEIGDRSRRATASFHKNGRPRHYVGETFVLGQSFDLDFGPVQWEGGPE